jgi:hypothetical protein
LDVVVQVGNEVHIAQISADLVGRLAARTGKAVLHTQPKVPPIDHRGNTSIAFVVFNVPGGVPDVIQEML